MSSGSGEVVGLRGQFPVPVGDPAARVGHPADGDALVADRDVGVMVRGLGSLGEAVDERDRGGKPSNTNSRWSAPSTSSQSPTPRSMAALRGGGSRRRPPRADGRVVLPPARASRRARAAAAARAAAGCRARRGHGRDRGRGRARARALLPRRRCTARAEDRARRGRRRACPRFGPGHRVRPLPRLGMRLLVNAALFAAIGYATGRWFLALVAFLVSTIVLSVNYNLRRLYLRERGSEEEPLRCPVSPPGRPAASTSSSTPRRTRVRVVRPPVSRHL